MWSHYNLLTQHTIINIKKKISLNYPKYNNVCSYVIFFLGTQQRVRKIRGDRTISVRATEVLLYFFLIMMVAKYRGVLIYQKIATKTKGSFF